MIILLQVAIGCCGLGLLFCIWALICNERTCRSRIKMADFLFAQSDWEYLLQQYDRVTYDDHFKALLFFRNASRLYSEQRLRTAVAEA